MHRRVSSDQEGQAPEGKGRPGCKTGGYGHYMQVKKSRTEFVPFAQEKSNKPTGQWDKGRNAGDLQSCS
jgi:hypothetical protein